MSSNIDRKFLEKLTELDDATLQNLIMTIARQNGSNEKQALRAAANVKRIRKKMSGMSDAEIQKVVESAGEEKVSEILDALDKKGLKP